MNSLNQRGTALIEALVSLPLFILLVATALTVAYLTFARIWLHHAAYESLVCLATRSTVASCEQRLRQASGVVLKIGAFQSIALFRSDHEAHLVANYLIAERIDIHLRDSIRLPLIEGNL